MSKHNIQEKLKIYVKTLKELTTTSMRGYWSKLLLKLQPT